MSNRIRFGDFEADVATGELRRDGTPVPIQDLPFRLLVALLERPGELVMRGDLAARLWGSETYVDSTAGLNTAVAKLREALGDNPDQPIYVETVPKRGYRFVGSIATPNAAASESDPTPAVPGRRRPLVVAMASLMTAAVLAFATYQLRANREPVRVAVMLFDNETGDTQLGRLSQGLTDAVVTALTSDSRLAVIGNAAVLRTARPFRDIAKVRDELSADYIVIGQVQMLDGGTIVRAHLIRGRDQAHVSVNVVKRGDAGEEAFQSAVAGEVRAAVAAHALAR
jgi:DNA-binding winged helix-turn-helix (wHTH) protein/TolB-like protein